MTTPVYSPSELRWVPGPIWSPQTCSSQEYHCPDASAVEAGQTCLSLLKSPTMIASSPSIATYSKIEAKAWPAAVWSLACRYTLIRRSGRWWGRKSFSAMARSAGANWLGMANASAGHFDKTNVPPITTFLASTPWPPGKTCHLRWFAADLTALQLSTLTLVSCKQRTSICSVFANSKTPPNRPLNDRTFIVPNLKVLDVPVICP